MELSDYFTRNQQKRIEKSITGFPMSPEQATRILEIAAFVYGQGRDPRIIILHDTETSTEEQLNELRKYYYSSERKY
ncbi:hypothetical protein FLK61_26095 [Paenalkalicoccus suaedae]|uniref:Uncharacterized protein n=1 Tax=Paenalkalicoccus suaedae TaxID=2592382 RepID=A0A859FDA7_9BACI|nr:hypothetical protein [Paenalkalicoccus suaedae]QKS70235.1 hypothetical protein FLK61_26095 [Paenalkalicoccus suaedae]